MPTTQTRKNPSSLAPGGPPAKKLKQDKKDAKNAPNFVDLNKNLKIDTKLSSSIAQKRQTTFALDLGFLNEKNNKSKKQDSEV